MRVVALVFLVFTSTYCNASVESTGVVKNILAEGGVVRFSVCDTNNACNAFWISIETNYGQSILSIVLSAKMLETTVWVAGADQPDSAWPYYSSRAFLAIDFR